MALDKQSLEDRIVANMVSAGANESGDHSWVRPMAKAIAEAVVDEFTQNAKADIKSGSSTGQHPIV